MKIYKTLVVEDEPNICKEIEWLVNAHPSLELLCSCDSVAESLQFIPKLSPDLILFDIQLGDGSSFDILNQLDEIGFQFIFVTAFDLYSIKAIKYGAFDYLLKPIDELEFREAIDRMDDAKRQFVKHRINLSKQRLEQKPDYLEDTICVSSSEFVQIIRLKEIVYCESDGGYTHIFLENGEKLTTSKTLKFYADLLPDEWFIRCHQSYLINRHFIDKFYKVGEIKLLGGKIIPVSLRKKEYVMKRLKTGK